MADDTINEGSLEQRAQSALGISLFEPSQTGREVVSLAPLLRLQQDPLLHQQIGSFLIQKKLGEGGFGSVYLGQHISTSEQVAIKILHRNLNDPHTTSRFQREAMALAKCSHPGIVQLKDFGLIPGLGFFLAMEFVPGKSLQQILKEEGAIPLPLVCQIMRQCCEILATVHSHSIIHRDLKPSNIMCIGYPLEDLSIKLIDFGVASQQDETRLTETGAALGTAKYMSPEQVEGQTQLDGRSDLYALAVLLFRILTGQFPITANNSAALMIKKLKEDARSLHDASPYTAWALPLEQFLQRALSRTLAERPTNAASFWRDCERALLAQKAVSITGVSRPFVRPPAAQLSTDAATVHRENAELPSAESAVFPSHTPYRTLRFLLIMCSTSAGVLVLGLFGYGLLSPTKPAPRPSQPAPPYRTIIPKQGLPHPPQPVKRLAPPPRRRAVSKARTFTRKKHRQRRRVYKRVRKGPCRTLAGPLRWIHARFQTLDRPKAKLSFIGCRQCKIKNVGTTRCLGVLPTKVVKMLVVREGYRSCVHSIGKKTRSLVWTLQAHRQGSLHSLYYPCTKQYR